MLALPHIVGLGIFAEEIGLVIGKRARADRDSRGDRGSFGLIWSSVILSVFLAISARERATGHFEMGLVGQVLALALVAAGLAFRWWAVVTLGRFFTVTVAIRAEHELVTRGPFRFVRHPSYTGLLLMFVGWSLTFESVWSIAGLLVPFVCALLYRVHVEEAALASAFGTRYEAYRARTKRLVPGVY